MILKMRLASLRMTTPLRVIMRGIMISSRQNGRKKIEPTDHLDHDSYSWCLRNYTICQLVVHNLQTFLPDVGFELTGMAILYPAFAPTEVKIKAHYQLNFGRQELAMSVEHWAMEREGRGFHGDQANSQGPTIAEK